MTTVTELWPDMRVNRLPSSVVTISQLCELAIFQFYSRQIKVNKINSTGSIPTQVAACGSAVRDQVCHSKFSESSQPTRDSPALAVVENR